jgi:type II secretory pathway component PulM
MIRLTKRERLIAITSTAFIAVWILFTFTIKPALARVQTLSRVIPEKQQELQKLRAKSREYLTLRRGVQSLRKKVTAQDESFGLLPFLESLIQEHGLAEKVVTMKQRILELEPGYSNVVIELELENLTLSQLINLLQQIQTSDIMTQFKNLHITKNRANSNLLNFSSEIHSPEFTQSAL